jgi:hypothetical protein
MVGSKQNILNHAGVRLVTTRTDTVTALAVWVGRELPETAVAAFLVAWAEWLIHTCSCTTNLMEVVFLTVVVRRYEMLQGSAVMSQKNGKNVPVLVDNTAKTIASLRAK